ncbi:MAG: dockerin type I domain-containing protein [Eubacteriales bacterium]|jgi:hypothetical protein|nr:dockerin type I domain-containing protein [Eubacteriales bacterium]
MIKSKGVLFLLVFCMIFSTYSIAAANTGEAVIGESDTVPKSGGSGGDDQGGTYFPGTFLLMLEADKPEVKKGESFSLVFSVEMEGSVLKGGSFTLEIPQQVEGGEPVFEEMTYEADQDGNITFTAGEGGISISEKTTIFTLPLTVKDDAKPGEITFVLKNTVFALDDDEPLELGECEKVVTITATLSGTIKTYGGLKALSGISAKLINTGTEAENELELTLDSSEINITPISINSFDEGMYKLSVFGAGFTTWETEFELDKENGHNFSITSFYPGDVYGDTNQVNFYDFHALCSYLNGDVISSEEENNSKYNIKYDLNRDGKIDVNDAAVLVQTYIASLEGGKNQ